MKNILKKILNNKKTKKVVKKKSKIAKKIDKQKKISKEIKAKKITKQKKISKAKTKVAFESGSVSLGGEEGKFIKNEVSRKKIMRQLELPMSGGEDKNKPSSES